MGLLNWLFGSTEDLARNLELSNEQIIKAWETYLNTVPEKQRIINGVVIDIKKLHDLLVLELANVHEQEKDEEDVIKDLKSIKHEAKIKRVHRLSHCLDYAATKYQYTYRLLEQIYLILIAQYNLLKMLEKESSEYSKIVSHFRDQVNLELLVIDKIQDINRKEGPNTFNELFLALIKGEHIIKQLDAREKVLLRRMEKIFSKEIPESITFRWVDAVVNSIEDKVHEGVDSGMFIGHHPDIHFEFVNRPEFVNLVREKINMLKPRGVSERMILIFVQIFRKGFNEMNLD